MHSSILRTHRSLTFLAVILIVFLLGCGNPTPKVYRVGILSGLDYFADTVDGFKKQMEAQGYVEGKNIVYDLQRTNVEPEKEVAILKKFVSDRVDLILVFPTEASVEAKEATKGTKIPVIFANAAIEGIPLVNSVREPGENITGVQFPGTQLAVKRLEILHELAPNAKRVYVTFLDGYPIVPPELDVVRPAAQAMGITLVEFPAKGIPDFQADLDARAKAADIGMDAILLIPEPLTVTPDGLGILAKFAAEHKIPVGGVDIPFGDYHSLFGLIPSNLDSGKNAAILADKVLRGTPAGTIPVVTPENVFTINSRVADGLGLKVSPGLLQMANQVIR